MASKWFLNRYLQESPPAVLDGGQDLSPPALAPCHDLSFDILDGIDVMHCEDSLNVSHDSFLNVSFNDLQDISSAVPCADKVIAKDSQTVSDTVVDSCSGSRENSCSLTYITIKAEVHASMNGIRCAGRLSLRSRKRKYYTRSKAKICQVASNLGSNDLSVNMVSPNDSKVKVRKTSGLSKTYSNLDSCRLNSNHVNDPYDDDHAFVSPKVSHFRGRKRSAKGQPSRAGASSKKSVSVQSVVASSSAAISAKTSSVDSVFNMSSLLFDCYADDHAFVTQKVSQPRGRKRSAKGKPSRAGASSKKSASLQLPVVDSSSGDLSPDEFDFDGFQNTDESSVSVTDVCGGAATFSKSERFQAAFRRWQYYNSARSGDSSMLFGVFFYSLSNVKDFGGGYHGVPHVLHELDLSDQFKIAILQSGSQRQGEVLIDSKGFKYSRRWDRGDDFNRHYRCRCKHCRATVVFSVGKKVEFRKSHKHANKFVYPHQLLFIEEVKKAALSNPFEGPHSLISSLYKSAGSDREFVEALGLGTESTSWHNLKQTIYRKRAKNLPPTLKLIFDPLDLQCLPACAPSFVRFDLQFRSGPKYGRFIGLATDDMLHYLFHANVWFVDATFRVVRPPFMQLLIVHVTMVYDGLSRSIPVFFILMTGRKIVQYNACLREMLCFVQSRFKGIVALNQILLDFEFPLWQAFRSMLSEGLLVDVVLKGCSFHFAQALYRRVQFLRLTETFIRDRLSRRVISNLMHLSYLPERMVVHEYNRLSEECTIAFVANATNAPLVDFCNYVGNNWIYGSRFSIHDFCQFQSQHRTNNVCESYHSQLRRRNFVDHMNTLALILRLWQEGQDIPALMDDFLSGRGKKTSVKSAAKEHLLDIMWDHLDRGLITGRFFLARLARRKVLVEDPEFAEHYCRAHLEEE